MRFFNKDNELSKIQCKANYINDYDGGYYIECQCSHIQLDKSKPGEKVNCNGCGRELVYMTYWEW